MQEFGQYRIDGLIGTGGMGEVYRAYDTRRDREVALKLLPTALSGDADYQRRFRREAYAVAKLREPHVVPIHDYGEIDGRLYIDMRLVDGQSLGRLIAESGPLAPRRAANLIGQVAEALDAAHADGVVHRDIKPTNILVTPSEFVYIVDFGIAHAVGHSAGRPTLTGATLGTLDYMAPERFESHPVDPRTDVHAAGAASNSSDRSPMTALPAARKPRGRRPMRLFALRVFPDPDSRPARHALPHLGGGDALILCDVVAVRR